MIGKAEYEQAEGVFHDALGTYFELIVHNALIGAFSLRQELLPTQRYEVAMRTVVDELREGGDDRSSMLELEIERIGSSGPLAVQNLRDRPRMAGATICAVRHTASEFGGGNAGDLLLDLIDGDNVPVSCKTDKSNRVALAGVGQTSIENAARAFYGVDSDGLEALSRSELNKSLDEVKQSYYTTSHLWRLLMIERLAIEGAQLNDFSEAKPTNVEGVRFLLAAVKGAIHGVDDALLLRVDRRTGEVAGDTAVDDLDPQKVRTEDISFTPGRPNPGKPVGTQIGIKWEGPGGKASRTIFTHQVKRQRGKNPSEAYRDITTRVETSLPE